MLEFVSENDGRLICHIWKIDSHTSLKETSTEKSSVKFFPNPSKGIFSVELAASNNYLQYAIYDINGKKLIGGSQYISNNILNFDLSHFSQGIYYMVINSANENYYGKIVIEH